MPDQPSTNLVRGTVEPGFEKVRDEFQRNFDERGELGAACAVHYRGRYVVDLWGGYRDHIRKDPWRQDTLAVVYSTTKGVSALVMAVAHSRGLIDYDERVARYWPEFAQNGKGDVTVRQLLEHQAGVCVIDEPLHLDVIADPDRLAPILAQQKPYWPPGTRHAYHTWTLGWYCSEILRRADPKHRTLGRYLTDEITRPLDLEFYIGLPDHIPDERVAVMYGLKPRDLWKGWRKLRFRFAVAFVNPWSLTSRTMRNPDVLGSDNTKMRTRDILAIEIPSGNGVGQMRSLARLYSIFAAGGRELGLRPETIAELEKPAVPPPEGMFDEVWQEDMNYRLGLIKPYHIFRFGSSDRAYGFPGAGGSFAFADPDRQLGYAYGMTRMGFRAMSQERENALRRAVYRCLETLDNA